METIILSQAQIPEYMTAFSRMASQVYQDDPVWVPQSEQIFQQNLQAWQPGGTTYFQPLIVVENSRILARAAAVMPPGANDEKGHRQGYIAFFECLPGYEQAGKQALQACEDQLRANGAWTVQAPRLDNLLMGLVVKGFDQPQSILSPHNPPYYQDIFRANGYEVCETHCSYVFTRQEARPFSFTIPGIHTRTFNRTCLDQEVRIFNELNDRIFRTHPGYVLRSMAEERFLIESFLPFLDDDLVIIAETSSGGPVGLLVCLPDIYQAYRGKPIDSARLITVGAIPSMVSKGIGVMMGLHLMRNLLARGYQTMEASWIRTTNIPPRNLANRFNGRPGREFVLFEKPL